MSFVDICLISLIILVVIFGLIRGFRKGIKSAICFSISIITAIFLAKLVANWLLSYHFIGRWIAGNNSLSEFVRSFLPYKLDNITLSEIKSIYESELSVASGEAAVASFFRARGITPFYMDLCYPIIKHALVNPVYLNSTAISATDIIALELAYGIFCLIIAVMIFFTTRVIVGLMSVVFKSKRERRIGFGSRLLGGILASARGFLYAITILCILSVFTSFTFFEPVSTSIDNSSLAKPIANVSTVISANTLQSSPEDERYSRLISLAGY